MKKGNDTDVEKRMRKRYKEKKREITQKRKRILTQQ